MDKPKFKLKQVTSLEDIRNGAEVPTSDYAITTDKEFIQFEYVDPNLQEGDPVANPGVYELAEDSFGSVGLKEIHINEDKILKDYSVAKDISNLVDKFFNKLDVYSKRGFFPKRAALLYGAPGLGKTQSILDAVKHYSSQDTITIFWPTSKLRSFHVTDFLKAVEYKNAKKLILVVEDVGGMEHNYGEKIPVDASLLALLDNSLGAFKVPTIVLATTNYPANLAEPLLRTGRFDDLIEVPSPNGQQRLALLKFFADDLVSIQPEVEVEIVKDKYKEFSVSDIKELVLKSELEETTLCQTLTILHKRKETLKKNFENRQTLGF